MQVPAHSAETLALQVLTWLLGQEDLLGVFMGSTGIGEADIRASAGDPVFLGSVLDFLVMDDTWVMKFCDAHGIDYNLPMQARMSLPGGETYNWT